MLKETRLSKFAAPGATLAASSPTIACWSSKGGTGTSVTAAVLALCLARRQPTVLVDVVGDQRAIFGLPSSEVGFWDWAATDDRSPESLQRLTVDVGVNLRSIAKGVYRGRSAARIGELVSAFPGAAIVLDFGRVGPANAILTRLVSECDDSLLVMRPCYLAAQVAMAHPIKRAELVFIEEPGRVLKAAKISSVLDMPIAAKVALDPALARLVDAGRLTQKLPRSARHLDSLAETLLSRETHHDE